MAWSNFDFLQEFASHVIIKIECDYGEGKMVIHTSIGEICLTAFAGKDGIADINVTKKISTEDFYEI
jgi:hypothetical protein